MRAEFFSGVDERGCVDGVSLASLADAFGTPRGLLEPFAHALFFGLVKM